MDFDVVRVIEMEMTLLEDEISECMNYIERQKLRDQYQELVLSHNNAIISRDADEQV